MQQSLDGFFVKARRAARAVPPFRDGVQGWVRWPASSARWQRRSAGLQRRRNAAPTLTPAHQSQPRPTPSSPSCCPPAEQYGATSIALLLYAAPIYWSGARRYGPGEVGQGEATADYLSSMRLLQNTSK